MICLACSLLRQLLLPQSPFVPIIYRLLFYRSFLIQGSIYGIFAPVFQAGFNVKRRAVLVYECTGSHRSTDTIHFQPIEALTSAYGPNEAVLPAAPRQSISGNLLGSVLFRELFIGNSFHLALRHEHFSPWGFASCVRYFRAAFFEGPISWLIAYARLSFAVGSFIISISPHRIIRPLHLKVFFTPL